MKVRSEMPVIAQVNTQRPHLRKFLHLDNATCQEKTQADPCVLRSGLATWDPGCNCYTNCQTTEFTDAMYNLPESELNKQFARRNAQRGRQLEDIQ